jgi:hypothetical protein
VLTKPINIFLEKKNLHHSFAAGEIYCTEPLSSIDRRDTHTDTQTDGRDFIKYAVEMGSVPVLCTPSFIKVGSGIQHGDCLSNLKIGI